MLYRRSSVGLVAAPRATATLFVLAIALLALPLMVAGPASANATRFTRGDAEAVFQALNSGGAGILLGRGVVGGAPAQRALSIRPFAAFDGRRYCALDWHLIATALTVGGDRSYAYEDAARDLGSLAFDFELDRQPLPDLTVTSIRRSVNPASLGLDEAYWLAVGAILGPERLALGSHTLELDITDPNGVVFDGPTISFFVDPAGAGACGSSPGTWNAAGDFRTFPNQANPSPDSQDRPGVWSYLFSEGLVHDPAAYHGLPNYTVVDSNREQWDNPGSVNLLVSLVRHPYPRLLFHSFGGSVIGFGRSAVLSWTSPVSGRVTVAGEVNLPPLAECAVGSGSFWSIDNGAGTLDAAILPAGGTARFDVTTSVDVGEILYFVHDPGFDSHCDSAFVDLTIMKP